MVAITTVVLPYNCDESQSSFKRLDIMRQNGFDWEGIPDRDYSIRKEESSTIRFNKGNCNFQRVARQISAGIEGEKIRVN